MLHQCEFNGKKDVLHFKLLQAAISENNAKKAYEQNAENLNENLDASRRHVVMNNEMKGDFGYPPDTHKFQFKSNQYRNFDDGASNDYEPRVKKPNVLSDHSSFGSDHQSRKKIKNLSATKFKPASDYCKQPSRHEKLHKPSRDKRRKLKRAHTE